MFAIGHSCHEDVLLSASLMSILLFGSCLQCVIGLVCFNARGKGEL